MTKSNAPRVGNAWRLALAASAIGQILAAPAGLAQQAGSDQETTELAPMLITGSLIPTTDIVGLTPIDVFSQVEIQKVGAANVTDVVRKLPAAVGAGNFNEARGNGGDGSARIALRGIPGGTLVLINGRRVAPVAFADSDVDINMIPLAAIERIEVLKDGASAVYGSDAIAGVVNIILRKEFEGVELYGYYGNTTERDAAKQQYSFVSGTSSDKGSFVVGGNYYKANSLFSQDRERSKVDVSSRNDGFRRNSSASSNPGRFRVRNDALGGGALYDPTAAADAPVYVTVNRTATGTPVFAPDGVTQLGTKFAPSDYHLHDNPNPTPAQLSEEVYPFDRYPFPLYTPAIRPAERYSVFGNGEYKLIEDTLKFFTEISYSKSKSQNQLAPTPITSGSVGYGVPASNPWNPFGTDISAWNYRTHELGPRTEFVDKDAMRFVSGLRGQVPESSWGYEVAFLYSQEEGEEVLGGELSRSRLETSMNSTDPAAAFNPFGVGANSPGVLNSVSQNLLTLGKSSLLSIDGRVNGEVVDLPGGPLAVSVGAEHREEEGESVPDAATQNGDTVGFNSADALYGPRRDVNSLYGEVFIPIFGEDNRIPGIYSMNVRGAVRWEDYSDFGDTTKPGVRFGYQPIETLTIHGSFSQSFRAPTISDLYTSDQENFPEVRNPYTGTFEQVQAVISGNPNLQPQEADNYLAGFEYRPKYVPGLKFAFDYFRIERENIPGGSTQYVIDENFRTGGPGVGVYSDLITFDPVSQTYQNVRVPTLNLSSDELDGFDIAATYDMGLEKVGLDGWGKVVFELNWQYLLSYEQVQIPGQEAVDRLGDFSADEFGYGTLPRLKGYGSLFWYWKDLEMGFYANYTDDYLDDKNAADRVVEDYLTFDIQASYMFPYQIKLTAGCLNVTDAIPPQVVGAFADNYDRDLHDLRQRFWYVSLSKRF